ncbi:MAG: hypothetical protein H6735_00125 [Alphaproteobacteria bacterium]|nr:hypothetical protein [Alphaproteobacteria bacterium]
MNISKTDGPSVAITIPLPADLHRQFRAVLALRGEHARAVLRQAVEGYVHAHKASIGGAS